MAYNWEVVITLAGRSNFALCLILSQGYTLQRIENEGWYLKPCICSFVLYSPNIEVNLSWYSSFQLEVVLAEAWYLGMISQFLFLPLFLWSKWMMSQPMLRLQLYSVLFYLNHKRIFFDGQKSQPFTQFSIKLRWAHST